jgi:hypothetical protein
METELKLLVENDELSRFAFSCGKVEDRMEEPAEI